MLKTRFIWALLCGALFCACRPIPVKTDAEPAEQTAKAVSDATRKAEADGNSGVIVNSSVDGAPQSQPTTESTAPYVPNRIVFEFHGNLAPPELRHEGQVVNWRDTDFLDALRSVATDSSPTIIVVKNGNVSALQAMLKGAKVPFRLVMPMSAEATPPEGLGLVTVFAKPPGAIMVDGKPVGVGTNGTLELAPGRYMIQVQYEDGQISKEKDVRVREKSNIRLFFRKPTK